MSGAAARASVEGERDLALAHTTAQFTRAKKLEPLARYLPVRPSRTTKKPSVMLEALQRIAAATAAFG